MHDAFAGRDATALRRLLRDHAELRARINEPVFGFDAPAIVRFADDRSMLDVLLEFGANPNQRSAWWAGGFHPLHSSTGEGAERLIAAGAIPANRSPLEVASQFGHEETLKSMLGFATPRQRLLFACRRGDDLTARALVREHARLIESMTSEDHRAVTDAAWSGYARAVALMLDLGFDPRTPGHDSGTALHCAAWHGSPETVAALLRHRDALQLIAIRDAHYGATPLGWCCHGSLRGSTAHDHAAVARLLLDAGAQTGADTVNASPSVARALAAAGHAN